MLTPAGAARRQPGSNIRGENSDLLSDVTVEEMVRRRPDCVRLTVPGQGHAPLLNDAATLGAIEAFVLRCQPME